MLSEKSREMYKAYYLSYQRTKRRKITKILLSVYDKHNNVLHIKMYTFFSKRVRFRNRITMLKREEWLKLESGLSWGLGFCIVCILVFNTMLHTYACVCMYVCMFVYIC